MIERRLLVHAAALVLAPAIVAALGLSLPAAILLVLLLLFWRWMIVLSGLVPSSEAPQLLLETIAASHFVEKVRWSMDRLGVDYVERPSGGTLGAFFGGRTVPRLKFRTGSVQSSIGNSAEILRYLWGRYAIEDPQSAAFLEPTRERVELEARLDRYGVHLQIWVYYHLLNDRELTLQAWGANDPATPYWQRITLKLLFPLLRVLIRKSFQISDDSYARAVLRIEELLGEVNETLADNRKSLLGDDETNYTDIAFAAMTGLWLAPDGFAAGRADAVRIEPNNAPAGMLKDIEVWTTGFSRVADFVRRLYAEERGTSERSTGPGVDTAPKEKVQPVSAKATS